MNFPGNYLTLSEIPVRWGCVWFRPSRAFRCGTLKERSWKGGACCASRRDSKMKVEVNQCIRNN